MKTLKSIFINLICLLFFVVFAVSIFIVVSLLTPDKPNFFESIGIENIDRGGL